MKKFLSFWKSNRFGVISWLVTAALVASLLGGAFWSLRENAPALDSALVPQPTADPDEAPNVTLPLPPVSGEGPSVERQIQLITNIPAGARGSKPIIYIVEPGDSISSIAAKFGINQKSIYYFNDELDDNSQNLKVGKQLVIPPMDGIYYTWKEGDTLEKVAAQFKAKVEDIIYFPGNDVDLTNPDFKTGTLVIIPGGSRPLKDPYSRVPGDPRGNNTGTTEIGGNSCGIVNQGDGYFGWPTDGAHTISGNNYTSDHLGIDITANTGTPIRAADDGVVIEEGWSEYGYGNVVMIDHGNGFITVYAHLSQINVSLCEAVNQSTVIGLAGNTGNSFGAHLHFEIRKDGGNVNPLLFL